MTPWLLLVSMSSAAPEVPPRQMEALHIDGAVSGDVLRLQDGRYIPMGPFDVDGVAFSPRPVQPLALPKSVRAKVGRVVEIPVDGAFDDVELVARASEGVATIQNGTIRLVLGDDVMARRVRVVVGVRGTMQSAETTVNVYASPTLPIDAPEGSTVEVRIGRWTSGQQKVGSAGQVRVRASQGPDDRAAAVTITTPGGREIVQDVPLLAWPQAQTVLLDTGAGLISSGSDCGGPWDLPERCGLTPEGRPELDLVVTPEEVLEIEPEAAFSAQLEAQAGARIPAQFFWWAVGADVQAVSQDGRVRGSVVLDPKVDSTELFVRGLPLGTGKPHRIFAEVLPAGEQCLLLTAVADRAGGALPEAIELLGAPPARREGVFQLFDVTCGMPSFEATLGGRPFHIIPRQDAFSGANRGIRVRGGGAEIRVQAPEQTYSDPAEPITVLAEVVDRSGKPLPGNLEISAEDGEVLVWEADDGGYSGRWLPPHGLRERAHVLTFRYADKTSEVIVRTVPRPLRRGVALFGGVASDFSGVRPEVGLQLAGAFGKDAKISPWLAAEVGWMRMSDSVALGEREARLINDLLRAEIQAGFRRRWSHVAFELTGGLALAVGTGRITVDGALADSAAVVPAPGPGGRLAFAARIPGGEAGVAVVGRALWSNQDRLPEGWFGTVAIRAFVRLGWW